MAVNGVDGGVSAVAVTSPQSTSKTTSQDSTSATTLDYDTYLQLLVAQMENQDPLSPTESTEWVAQLATFSQVEQSIETNSQLSQVLSSLQFTQSEALIGRTITSSDGSVSGEVKSVRIATDGLIATLADGQEMPIVDGVTVT
ncbi:MAG: flagellar hook assembly protein FlgD [Pseudomonadota bacterium]